MLANTTISSATADLTLGITLCRTTTVAVLAKVMSKVQLQGLASLWPLLPFAGRATLIPGCYMAYSPAGRQLAAFAHPLISRLAGSHDRLVRWQGWKLCDWRSTPPWWHPMNVSFNSLYSGSVVLTTTGVLAPPPSNDSAIGMFSTNYLFITNFFRVSFP